jgi:predicted 3-demethylubiquinone-9 3-methyltransferase (glyoxalase superfamily)
MSRIVPNLWYTDKAEEAAAFYASILPNSKVDAVTALPANRLAAANKKPKVIIVAVMRKMITTLNAMVGDNAAWQPRAA